MEMRTSDAAENPMADVQPTAPQAEPQVAAEVTPSASPESESTPEATDSVAQAPEVEADETKATEADTAQEQMPEAEAAEALKGPADKAEVLEALTRLASADAVEISREEVARLKQLFYSFRKAELEAEMADFLAAGNAEADFLPALDPAEEQFKELMNAVRDRKAALTAAHEAELAANLERKKALIEELQQLSADTDNVNRTFPRVKEIQVEFKAIGDVPPTEATDLWKTYQATVEQFYDQLKVNKDLRDYDFRKNLELKTLLCEEAEKLDADDDVVLAFKRLQNLHDEWRQTGPVAKELREEIWQRFKDASAVVNKKYQAFFEERKAREAANEQAKTAICERVEAIDCTQFKSFGAWEEATKTIIAAQQEWKTLGFASRKVNNALFARFRKACDNFFTLKGEHYRAVKDELATNLAKKIALCEQAEALSESTDWRRTADRLVALQKEWKTIGTVAKKQSDAVWQRFQKACDTFFEARKRNQGEGRSEEQTNLKAKREIIEALKAIGADTPRAEAMPKVKELQARWQEIGHVPFREKDKIYDEYRTLCDAFYSRVRRDGAGASRFEDVVREMSGDAAKLRRERDRIVRAYEIKRNELKTYENNLGFLSSKSKSGDSMVREMERRIQRIKDDLAAIEQKIALIDARL